MSELGNILFEQVNRLLAEAVSARTLEEAERGVWPGELWRAVEAHGLARVCVPEAAGGVGGGWGEAEVVIRAAGRYQTPVPLAESVLAGWLLAGAGLAVPEGPLSVAPVRAGERLELEGGRGDWRLAGSARRVPWGRAAGHLAVLARHRGDPYVALVEGGSWQVDEERNVAAEPRDGCRFEAAAVAAAAPAADGVDADTLWRLGAMVRAGQIAGALDCVLDHSVQYAKDRVQFGRPIGKFQAVQQELARLAGETAAAGAAAEAAFRAAERGDARVEIAAAKIRAGEAATAGAAIAHQTHGAMGFTYEHALHFATRRLWSWRAEFGSESYWAEELGRAVAARGADALWPFIAERPAG